jgi:2-iminobutanoate/2-iminopropanoate deaminase
VIAEAVSRRALSRPTFSLVEANKRSERTYMPKRVVELPVHLPPPRGAYSAVIRAGDFVYVSGQSARDRDLKIVGHTIEDQTRKTIENIAEMLNAAGARWEDVVKSTVHLSDLRYFPRYDAVYAEIVPSPRPVRTTVGSVLAQDILVEIDVVAYAPVR